MSDEDDRREFIDSNSGVLAKSTVVGVGLVVRLYSKGLIDDEEKDLLLNHGTPNIKRAALLYTQTANKWSRSQFEDFKSVLQETGNSLALQVFTNASAAVVLTNEQVQLIKEQRHKSEVGCYEGLSLEDEATANIIVEYARGEFLFRDGNLKLCSEKDRKNLILLVKCFTETLKNGDIWWNPKKPRLPLNYIPRRIARTNAFNSDGNLQLHAGHQTLIELNESRLVLLVDSPGMGKSSEFTLLEQKLRIKISRNRVIVRINLNEVERVLATLSPSESALSVLLKLAPFLPKKSLQIPNVFVCVLLDGLDEVCPRHQATMNFLLRILTDNNEPTFGDSNLRVFVTTRPHLRRAVEEEFNVESVSLLPLTQEEQDSYMRSVLGVSNEQLSALRANLTNSIKELLSNPLMLSMFVEVIKSNGSFSEGGDDVNIFNLYERFVDSKHQLLLVEKEGMRAEDNYTEIRLVGMLERNLPQYYRVALTQLLRTDVCNSNTAIKAFSGIAAAQEEPSGVTRDELLSIGLLSEGTENQLVFKHRSFAEFFYARLMTREENIPQVGRDMLFGNIYKKTGVSVLDGGLENVECFVLAAAASIGKQTKNIQDYKTSSAFYLLRHKPIIHLTAQWLLMEEDFLKRCHLVNSFVTSKNLFPLFAPEVLVSFVNGDPVDLWEVLRVLLHEESGEAFSILIRWMSENRSWTRTVLFKINENDHLMKTSSHIYNPHVISLMATIAVHFECQQLLTTEEVKATINSVDRLIHIVAHPTQTTTNKWDFVEANLRGGRSQLRDLFKNASDSDFYPIIHDKDTAWKLMTELSHEEIYALITEDETRVSDIVGKNPQEVIFALGEHFLLPPNRMAKFRGKFGTEVGKTMFEMGESALDFAIKCLVRDILPIAGTEMLAEYDRGNFSNQTSPVGSIAVKEALGRIGESDSWTLVQALETEIRRLSCSRQPHKDSVMGGNTHQHCQVGVKMMDWVTSNLRWSPIPTATSNSLDKLPFLLRYCPNVLHSHLTTLLLQHQEPQLKSVSHHMALLKSLVISLFPSQHDSTNFSLLVAFLRKNLDEFPASLRPVTEVFLRASKEEIITNATFHQSSSSPLPLVSDVSVGGVFLRLLLLPQQQQSANNVKIEIATWIMVLRDVINFTPCCEFPAVLQQLRFILAENLLKEVLTSGDVFLEWQERFWCIYRREGEEFDSCGLTHLLSFYFSVFGLNPDWMKMQDGATLDERADRWKLVKRLPVEIATVFETSMWWTHLLPPFQEMLNEFIRKKSVNSVTAIARWFPYEKLCEWKRLLKLVNGESILHPFQSQQNYNYEDIPTASVAAPLFRALIKLYGVNWTRSRLSQQLWNKIPSTVKFSGDSVASLGSLLHSAIELKELKQVQSRAWPGVLAWRNEDGKDALDIVKDKLEERDPIRTYLEELILSKRK